jgi:hypothetical protein
MDGWHLLMLGGCVFELMLEIDTFWSIGLKI